jgi:radical SAM protein with 4Fe4S-binding SPASM domain
MSITYPNDAKDMTPDQWENYFAERKAKKKESHKCLGCENHTGCKGFCNLKPLTPVSSMDRCPIGRWVTNYSVTNHAK